LLHSFWGASDKGTDWKISCFVNLAVVGGLTTWFLSLPIGSGAIQLSLNDPDNYQRLVEVRDWLSGQSWWDTRQYRVNPPEGLQMHWSRLADVPLAALILLFMLLTDYATAEILAVVVLPSLLLLGTLVLLGRAARHVGGVPAERFVQLFIAATPTVLSQYVPGRVDHHGLQMFLLSGAIAAATANPTFRSGVLLSLVTTLSLLVGLETVPLLLVICVWVPLCWLLHGEPRRAQLQGFLLGSLLFLPLFFALSVSPADWGRLTNDEVGIGHIAIVASSAATLAVSSYLGNSSPGFRIAAIALAGIVAVATLLAFPSVLTPPYAAIDPILTRLWISEIAETESAWDVASAEPVRLLFFHLFPVLGLAAGVLTFLSTGRPANLFLILMIGAAGVILCVWQFRAMTPASLVSLLLCSITLAHLMKLRERPFGKTKFYAAIVVLNGLFGPALYYMLVQEEEQGVVVFDATPLSGRCEQFLRGPEYDEAPPGLSLNGISSGALILARTHHSVLAAGNHRATEGNGQAYQLFLAPASEARRAIAARGVDYLFTCRDGELQRLAGYAPGSLAADLYEGRAPDWLVPLPHAGGKAVLFYAIAREPSVSEKPRTGQPSK
jgi:hypothetical protein